MKIKIKENSNFEILGLRWGGLDEAASLKLG
jgi:hypothetical protein